MTVKFIASPFISNNNTKIAISYHIKLKMTILATENVSCDYISLFSGYNCQGYFVTFLCYLVDEKGSKQVTSILRTKEKTSSLMPPSRLLMKFYGLKFNASNRIPTLLCYSYLQTSLCSQHSAETYQELTNTYILFQCKEILTQDPFLLLAKIHLPQNILLGSYYMYWSYYMYYLFLLPILYVLF